MAGKHVVIVNDSNFEAEVLKSSTPVLIDFTATWCGPCKMIAPLIDELADETVGVFKIAKVDIDDAPTIAAKFGVRSVPTLLAVKDGKEVSRHVGANTNKAKLRAMLTGGAD